MESSCAFANRKFIKQPFIVFSIAYAVSDSLCIHISHNLSLNGKDVDQVDQKVKQTKIFLHITNKTLEQKQHLSWNLQFTSNWF